MCRVEEDKATPSEITQWDQLTNRICRCSRVQRFEGSNHPIDKNKNRYMITFVGHKSNYYRVFLAKTKDPKKFEHFLV